MASHVSAFNRLDSLIHDKPIPKTRTEHREEGLEGSAPLLPGDSQRYLPLQVRIHIAQNWVAKRLGRLMIEISDWANFQFRYDCQLQAYVVSDVKLGGI